MDQIGRLNGDLQIAAHDRHKLKDKQPRQEDDKSH